MGPTISGAVRDLGPAGVGIRTGSGLRIGERYEFTLELPGARRRRRARVRWCRLVATRRRAPGDVLPVFHAGLSWC